MRHLQSECCLCNEPSLPPFWTFTQTDDFELDRSTALALQVVDARIEVGGPATASNEWITDFVDFCEQNDVPVDIVSTHHYRTDRIRTDALPRSGTHATVDGRVVRGSTAVTVPLTNRALPRHPVRSGSIPSS